MTMKENRWSDPYQPKFRGDRPLGVSYATHEIQSKNFEFDWSDNPGEPVWYPSLRYRYRPRPIEVLSFDELNKKRDSVKAELDAIDEELQRRDDEEYEEMKEAYEFLAGIYEARGLPDTAAQIRTGVRVNSDAKAAEFIRSKLKEVRNNG